MGGLLLAGWPSMGQPNSEKMRLQNFFSLLRLREGAWRLAPSLDNSDDSRLFQNRRESSELSVTPLYQCLGDYSHVLCEEVIASVCHAAVVCVKMQCNACMSGVYMMLFVLIRNIPTMSPTSMINNSHTIYSQYTAPLNKGILL